jgi:hypothetical protein
MTDTITAALIGLGGGVGGTLLGMVVQHRFEMKRTREERAWTKQDARDRRVAEKADQYVSEFLQLAYFNLRFLTRDKAREGMNAMADFAVLARRASLYLDGDMDKELNQYTTRYAGALMNLCEPRDTVASVEAENFADFQPQLDLLHKRIKAAIQGQPQA